MFAAMRRDQMRSTLTTLKRGSGSLFTFKTKPCGQLGSDRSSVTILADTETQRSISTGMSAGQPPRHVRSSSMFLGVYRGIVVSSIYYPGLASSTSLARWSLCAELRRA
jgi:hypothetical protein